MATVTFHSGDLLRSGCSIMTHQVNCQAKMGRGIAKQIRKEYPFVYKAYVKYCRSQRKKGRSPLGDCQLVKINDFQWICNLFGQEFYGIGSRQTDYRMLERALTLLAGSEPVNDGLHNTIGFPDHIGCGLGGGDWNVVLPLIQNTFANWDGNIQFWSHHDVC